MGFLYSFTTPDAAQLKEWRRLLDFYGQFAQLSALIPLLAYPVFYYANKFLSERFRLLSGKAPPKERTSPIVSRFGDQTQDEISPRDTRWARIEWFLDSEIWQGWGTWRELLIGTLWALWLLFLCIKDTKDGMFNPLLEARSISLPPDCPLTNAKITCI